MVDRFKNSQTTLSDLYNHVPMGKKSNQESKDNENHPFIIEIFMKKIINCGSNNNSDAEVYGEIFTFTLSFHFLNTK